MVTRSTWAPPTMAVGYHPICSSKPGNYPCFPILPRFGLLGLGSTARIGRGDGPVFTGGSNPSAPQLGGRRFGRGFRFPSTSGPFFADGTSAGCWTDWSTAAPSDQYSYPYYSYPVLPDSGGLKGFGAMRPSPVNPVVPRYGLSDLSMDGSGILGTGLFGNNWGVAEIVAALFGGFALYSMFSTTKRGVTKGYLTLEGAAQRRRKRKAAKYRAKAKKLEERGLGGIFA